MPRKRKTPKEASSDGTAPSNTVTTADPTPGTSQGPSQPTATSSVVQEATTESSTASPSSQTPIQASSATPSNKGKAPATDFEAEAKAEEEVEIKDKRPTPPLYPLPAATYQLVWYHNRTSPAGPSRCSPASTITITSASPPPLSSPARAPQSNARPTYTATLVHNQLNLTFSVNYGLKQVYTHNQKPYTSLALTPTAHTVLQNKGCTSVTPESLLSALAKQPPREQMWGTGSDGREQGTGLTMRVPINVAMSLERDDRGEQFVEFWAWVDGGGWKSELVWAVGKMVGGGWGWGVE
ncbi:hypothetical protein G7Y79_00047g082850 [Physcia stellaris]|nr:hypothetical protein G7Y79_00047g082850 [Physcia stellaris]